MRKVIISCLFCLVLMPIVLFAQMPWQCLKDSTSWSARGGHGLVNLDGTLILCGGWFGDPPNAVFYHDSYKSTDGGRTWDFLGLAPWSERSLFTFRAIDDSTVIMTGGGIIEGGIERKLSDVWLGRYDGQNLSWELLCDSAFPGRAGHAMGIIGNTYVVAGGIGNDSWPRVYRSDVYASSDGGRSWRLIRESADWNFSVGLTMAEIGSTLVLYGGFLDTITRVISPQVWISNDTGTTWNLVADTLSCSSLRNGESYVPMVSLHDTLVLLFSTLQEGASLRVLFSPDTGHTWLVATDSFGCEARSFFPMVVSRDTLIFVGGRRERVSPQYRSDVWASGGPIVGLREETRAVIQPTTQTPTIILRSISQLRIREPSILTDISGRKVADLRPGTNNIQHLRAGIYFLLTQTNADRGRRQTQNTQKIVFIE